MNDIWNISDPTDFVYALWNHIIEKCEYGKNMDALTPEERIFFITQWLETEVNNGGFSQFFFNSSGNFSAELVDAFTAIGAVKTAAICQQALDAFGQALPADCEERRKLLDKIETDEIDDALSACDDAFYEYEEDLARLNYDYVQKHKAAFT